MDQELALQIRKYEEGSVNKLPHEIRSTLNALNLAFECDPKSRQNVFKVAGIYDGLLTLSLANANGVFKGRNGRTGNWAEEEVVRRIKKLIQNYQNIQ